MGRYARLKKEWVLRGWTDMPWVLVNQVTGDKRKLKQHGAYIAQACDGRTDFSTITFLPLHHVLLDGMIERGIVEECEPGDCIDPYQRYRKADNSHLSGLDWSVTGHCNLNCRHCYMEAPSNRYGELSLDASMRVIEEMERANVQSVSLTGGEPFVRSDLLGIIAALTQKKIRLEGIFTNGLALTTHVLESIRRIGAAPSFQISFDGVGAHDYMRGREGIEASVIESIRRACGCGFPVVVATSIDLVTKDCLFNTYGVLKALGIQHWQIAPPRTMGNWRAATTGLSCDEQVEVYRPLLRRWQEDGKPFAIDLGGFFRGAGREGAVSMAAPTRQQSTPEGYSCVLCREHPYLLPDGTLLPCPAYVGTHLQDRMPNILADGLSKAWNDPLLRSVVDIRNSELLDCNPECTACEYFEKCGCGCRASAFLEAGSLTAADPLNCELHKKGYAQAFTRMAEASGR